MELLNDQESRSFSSFLDSFVSTSKSPTPQTNPHTPQESHGYNGQSQETRWNGSLPPMSDQVMRGGADPYSSSSSSFATNTYGGGILPRHSPPYNNHTGPPILHSTASFSFAPPPPPLGQRRPSTSNPYHQPHQPQQDSEVVKQRKLQHAQELEKWMAQSRTNESTSHGARNSFKEVPSPLKRTKSQENGEEERYEGSGRNREREREKGGEEEDPIKAMLEAERKAGYAYGRTLNAAITRESTTSQGSGHQATPPLRLPSMKTTVTDPQEVFAVPRPPPAPTSTTSRSNRRRSSASTASEIKTLPPLPDLVPSTNSPKTKAPSKRKAPPSTASSSRSSSISSKPTTIRKQPKSTTQPPPPPEKEDSESPSLVDPESADSNLASISPTPFPTPRNIPPPPPSLSTSRSRKPRSYSTTSSSALAPSTSTIVPTLGQDGKPILLTVEQKKANHILSEQKRRAAIRKGYDDLCNVVPVLREAVEEFEERVRRLENSGGGGNGRGKKRKGKGKGGEDGMGGGSGKTGALMGGINVGGEKIDGRAGPKSEAVVLSKSESSCSLSFGFFFTSASDLAADASVFV